MKLSKWRIRYRHKEGRVFTYDAFDNIYEFCTEESFTPMEALRVGMDALGKDVYRFDSLEYKGQTEKLP